MIYRFLGLVFLGLLCMSLEARIDLSEVLYPFIEEELERVKMDLDSKFLIEKQIGSLQEGLDRIWENIKKDGFSENAGTDAQLRPAYITMQGVIETAITRAFKKQLIKDVVISIITPRMPTPLMVINGRPLSELNLSDPKAFAFYRNLILVDYLRAGGVLNTVYSYNAKDALSNQELALATYFTYCETYSNLVDSPVIQIDIENFPDKMTGAVYVIDGQVITIESRQVSQVKMSKQKWAIKFGQKAETRKEQIDSFLKLQE